MKFLKQADYLGYVTGKPSKYVNMSSCRIPQIPFTEGSIEKKNGSGASFQATFLVEFFDKKFSFAILQ